VHGLDARWLMAYAAGLGESAPEYVDTLRPGGLLAHPLFPVCYEWPAAVELRERSIAPEIAARGVHATHDLWLHRRPRAGDRLGTIATIARVEPRRPGAYVLTRFDTVDAEGRPVSRTLYGSLYLGVDCDPEQAPTDLEAPDDLPPAAGLMEAGPTWTASVAVAPTLAHVYTECARIWNPIHTDRAAALAAGLPDMILHGTATLALCVSRVLAREAAGPGAPVRRIACRFGGMVAMGSTLTVEGVAGPAGSGGRWVGFRARGEDGKPAVRDGWLLLGEDEAGQAREPLTGSR
jgi:acyl dehydratase